MDTQQTEQIVKELNSFIKNLDRWATQLQTATVILPIISIIASFNYKYNSFFNSWIFYNRTSFDCA